MHWTWLITRPNVNAAPIGAPVQPCVSYTDWIFWHYHVLIPRNVA
jgi:hypothetical protein